MVNDNGMMKMSQYKLYILLIILSIIPGIYGDSDNKCAANDSTGNYAGGDNIGIYLLKSNNNNIIENSVIGNRVGIYLIASNNSTIEENIVSNNSEYGLFIEDSNGNIIAKNRINHNVYSGISIWDSQDNLLTDNIALCPIIINYCSIIL